MPTLELDPAQLQRYRARSFHLQPEQRLRTVEEARGFVGERGFVYFWPIAGVVLPSLWAAVAGDRPVPNEHDDPGHITWGWKDQALDKRWWYYAKVLRGRATLIALDVAPVFYALSENYGEPEHDYLDQYRDGQLTHEARLIYEAVLETGPLDTVNLRRQIHLTSAASNTPFENALAALQRDFKILPVGVAATGAWRYSFIYECTHRWYPDLPGWARLITRAAARQQLAGLYLAAVGAATSAQVRKVFQWKQGDVEAALAHLAEAGEAAPGGQVPGEKGEWWVWNGFVDDMK